MPLKMPAGGVENSPNLALFILFGQLYFEEVVGDLMA